MPGSHIKFLLSDMRSDYRKVSVFLLDLAEEILQTGAQFRSLGKPQRQTSPHLRGESEKFQFLTYLPVIPLLGLFEKFQIFIEHRFLGECDTVYAGEHLVLLIPPPVCTGDRGEFYGFDDRRVAEMGSAAQIGEIAVRIERDGPVFEISDKFAFIFVTLFGEGLHRLFLGNFPTHETLLRPGQFHHLVLYLLQVTLHQCHTGNIHIIVETVLDGRSDTEFDTRIQAFQSLGHQMGG